MSTVIKVENLSKQYRLGNVGSGNLKDDLTRWWYRMRGKEDPLLQIDDTNDRTVKGDSEYVWALKDINFEVQQGDVLGIIGRNGAGKSTLLKILSKTTAPTTGSVKVKGRIASLLEVGTGFHPELTGRENIYLNGAILGMRKHEITCKLDEIIDFAGVERYIDTPVKRYSSGMYVRLAFGVAAHLESEILIIDEVLAVGDAEFQKKCLGKMSDVSKGEGRTVLFVSHNAGAIQSLCSRGLVLQYGKTIFTGNANSALDYYLRSAIKLEVNEIIKKTKKGNGKIIFRDIQLIASTEEVVTSLKFGEPFRVKIFLDSFINVKGCVLGYSFVTKEGFEIQGSSASDSINDIEIDVGLNIFECNVHLNPLVPGLYFIRCAVFTKHELYEHIDEALSFNINEINYNSGQLPIKHYVGNTYIHYQWKKINMEG